MAYQIEGNDDSDKGFVNWKMEFQKGHNSPKYEIHFSKITCFHSNHEKGTIQRKEKPGISVGIEPGTSALQNKYCSVLLSD